MCLLYCAYQSCQISQSERILYTSRTEKNVCVGAVAVKMWEIYQQEVDRGGEGTVGKGMESCHVGVVASGVVSLPIPLLLAAPMSMYLIRFPTLP
ncbi:hypothetical protein B296_00038887 [Ensete ventricosum]|uniref:Uncharacterized protein n=1 Tax=Ensete ventricosum TaxID=4639 RepID=A0A426ZQY3_ENSVE|nr:hypothetical protein B296_00038887 [Ensete ventricosum]